MINLDDRLLNEVNENEMWFLLHIAKRIRNNTNVCFPSIDTICKDTGFGERKTRTIKKSLIKKGLMEAEPRYLNDSRTSDNYRILTDYIGIMMGLGKINSMIASPGQKRKGGTGQKRKGGTGQKRKGKLLTIEAINNLRSAAATFDEYKVFISSNTLDLGEELGIISSEYFSISDSKRMKDVQRCFFLKKCRDYLIDLQKEKSSVKKESDFVELEEVYNPQTTADVKQEIKRQGFSIESGEARLAIWKLYEPFLQTESFMDQYEFSSPLAGQVDHIELMKIWIQKVDWFLLVNVKINKLKGWIERYHFEQTKNTQNGKSRNNKNLVSTEQAKRVFDELMQDGI